MMRIKNLHTITSKGKRYYYHRITRKRITGEPGTAEFLHQLMVEDQKLEKNKPVKGTLASLIKKYRASPEFQALAPRTRRDYENVMLWMQEGKRKDTPIHAITSPMIVKIRDAAYKSHKRNFANYVIAVFSILFNWGKQHGITTNNPAQPVKKIRRPKGTPGANRPWTKEERKAVMEAAPDHLKLPIALSMYAALRQGDVVRLTWAAYDGISISTIQQKSGEPVWIPTMPPLKELLDKTERKGKVICLTSKGTPWTENGLRASFFKLIRKLMAEGKVQPGLTFHGLRHSIATDIAEAGGSEKEIMSVLGHTTEAMASHYSRRANRKELARKAMGRKGGE